MYYEKKTKQPAHKVILAKLRERVEFMTKNKDKTYKDGLRELGVTAMLLDVLREMVIPEKERESVLAELRQLAETWEGRIDAPNMVAEACDSLKHD